MEFACIKYRQIQPLARTFPTQHHTYVQKLHILQQTLFYKYILGVLRSNPYISI